MPQPPARDVVLAALAQPLPATAKTEDRADLIVAALTDHGYLPAPNTEPTLAEIEEVARWVAEASHHPRYAGDGWERILQSTADVHVAINQALPRATQREAEDLRIAQGTLLRWHDTHEPRKP